MHLKRLELFGFKTFPDKTILEFTDATGITAIVGPNGCGKSNIIDAFRWVMGEQSIKLLRGTSQEEIIFAGTDDRKPVSMAEVALTIDNSDHKLAIDYNEVQIARRFYRSGESEYLINKQVVRLKDVQELLMDTGIGKGSYAIIGQGQVIEILHSKPEDRRALFEEAAGINKYKTRKVVTQRKLAQAEQNLFRLRDIRSEIHQQLGPLEEQARVASEYQVLKKDLAGLEVGLYKEKIGKINQFKEQVEKAIAEYKTVVSEADNKAEDIMQKKQEFRAKIVGLEQNIAQLNQALQDVRLKKEETGNKLNLSQERISNQTQRINSLEQEIQQLEKNREGLLSRQSETNTELTAIEQAVLELQDKMNKKNEETRGIFDRWQYISLEITELRSVLTDIDNEIEVRKSKLMGLGSSERVINGDIQRAAVSITTAVTDRDELARKEQELQSRKIYVDTTVTGLRQKRDDLFKQKSEKEEERKTLLQERGDVKEKYDSQSSRLKLLDEMQQTHEGFQKGVRSVFQAKKDSAAGFNGVRGVIADLLTVPKKYESAIEAALESNLQAIVVESETTVKDVIQHLRSHSLGRATFLAADNSFKQANVSVKNGVLASDVVTATPQYKQLIDQLLCTVVIVDTLDEALQLRKGFVDSGVTCLVTLAGDIVTVSGMITGGSTGNEDISLLGRQREIIELRKDIEQYKTQLETMDQQIKAIEKLFVEIENNLKEYGNELKALEIEQGTVANDLARITIDKGKLERILQTNTQNKTEYEQEMNKINAEKNNVNNLLQDLLQKKDAQMTVIRQKEDELSLAASEKEKVNELLTEIKIGTTNAEGTRRQIELKLESFRESLAQTLNQIKQKTAEREKILSDKATTAEQLTLAEQVFPEFEASLAELQGKIQEANTERTRYFNDLEVYDRMEKERNSTDRDVRSKLAEEEIKMARIEAEFEEMRRRLTTEYNMTLEEALLVEAVIEDYDKTQDEVEKLKRKIKRMEPVNLLAIEEYEAQKERLAFIENQCEDLKKSKEDMNSIIKELDRTAIEAFKQAFDIVNLHFQRIFVDLFKGGYGELKIMDETNVLESGIEIYAKVPGSKKAQSMLLLSGGQKALTAIALLFSLLSARPGPFCILDEIDAELDDINISRVTDILRKYSQETQIIIITHRQPTMSVVSAMFGLTMEQKGISKVVSVKLGLASAANKEAEPVEA